jgi:mannose-6-phosphate isomerase-like protein (cupin superfamily)
MTEQEWKDILEKEGFTDVRVCPIPPAVDAPEHTHEDHTVHVILSGGLIIIDDQGTRIFEPGERVEFPAGTTHKAKGKTSAGTMIIGVKK